MNMFFICLAILVAVPALAFQRSGISNGAFLSRTSLSDALKEKVDYNKPIKAPDFYWKFRIDRLEKQYGADFPFNAANYPVAHETDYRMLHSQYFLDLTLNKKIATYDPSQDWTLTDDEWVSIYDMYQKWSKEITYARQTKQDMPENDFDFVKKLYPWVKFRSLEEEISAEEVGPNFPYKNLKEVYSAAAKDQFKFEMEGVPSDVTVEPFLEQIKVMKANAKKEFESIYQECLALVENPIPDDEAREHYRKLKTKLAALPLGSAQMAEYRANFEKEVEEMARFASRQDDHHSHHHEDEGEEHEKEGDHHSKPKKMTVAMEFEQKYGRKLDEMEKNFRTFRTNPSIYMETVIKEKYGQKGIYAWKKARESSAKFATLTPEERKAKEDEYKKFLDSIV